MSADYEIRQGDFGGRALAIVITDAAGAPVEIPDGSTCTFRMKGRFTGQVVEGSAALGNYGTGTRNKLSWSPVEGDTDVVDVYDAQFTAETSGRRETFPTTPTGPAGLTVEVTRAA